MEWLKKLSGTKRPEVDAASFGDPIALQTAWTPVAEGGVSKAAVTQGLGRDWACLQQTQGARTRGTATGVKQRW